MEQGVRPAESPESLGGRGLRPADVNAPPTQDAIFIFDNTYARELAGYYVPWTPAPAPRPELIQFNRPLADELGLDANTLDTEAGARLFAGNITPPGASPLAQAYAGHQFGHFSPQLGDGRALLLGEIIDRLGRRRDIQLKGSGRTPFSRRGDGKAALGPVLREYLISETLHALGIPTTRALAAVTTGETIRREAPLPGAVLTRVAASHIRVGTFEFFAARAEHDQVRKLADYVIARHYPDLSGQPDRYLALLAAVCDRQAALIARWMHVGFIHGVMNTDNMAISGETIDYGPCAFMDRYHPATVFSSIDVQGRYAYANQPLIARWNLARFAETLLPHLDADESRAIERAAEIIGTFNERYQQFWLEGMRAKLGLSNQESGDSDLAKQFLSMLHDHSIDFTLAFRYLADAAEGRTQRLRSLFADASAFNRWHAQWSDRLLRNPVEPSVRAATLRQVNPIFIPRNHRVEAALSAAVAHADYAPFTALLQVLSRPYEDQPEYDAWAEPAAQDQPPYQTFCGT
jgi:uncharacterized protein YdiU (UPF0061 family)